MLAGMAAGWLVRGAGRSSAGVTPPPIDMLKAAAPFALLAAAPDLDLLADAHSTYTHSIGAALITGIAALVLTRGQWAVAIAAAAAVGTHTLLDWLGNDTTPPIGIMALWPWSSDFYQSQLHVFRAVSRRYWQPGFYLANTWTVVREIAILTPVAAGACWFAMHRVAHAGLTARTEGATHGTRATKDM
jgi:inner membrane protein